MVDLPITTNVATVERAWDKAKNSSNRDKHGLDFADAEQVFAGRCVSFIDDRFDYGEKRLVTLGLLAGRVVVMAHAPRGREDDAHDLHEKGEPT